MLADKQEDPFPAHHRGSRQDLQCEGLRRRRASRPSLEPRWQDDQARRLRHQPDLPLAGREGVQPENHRLYFNRWL